MHTTFKGCAVLLALVIGSMQPVHAESTGRETGFDIPRFVSMRSSKANVRRGPTTSHQIDWVFEREKLPVIVRAEFGHWRLIEDYDGDGGWVHRALITGAVTGMVVKEKIQIHSTASANSAVLAVANKGLIVDVDNCTGDWCRVSHDQATGWVAKDDVWGVENSQIQP